MTLPFSLAGRTAFISGASSGLGAHFARLYAAAGAQLVIGARRIERVEALAEAINRGGGKALAVTLDVTDEASVIAAYDRAEAELATPDIIVANAGTESSGRSTAVPVEGVQRVIDTNFVGVYLTVREGARRLIAAGAREKGHGRAIIISSITAHLTGEGDGAYAASKAGVAHLGKYFAREWVRMGINVNVIRPGYIPTEIQGDWYATEGGQRQIAGFHRRRLQAIESLDPMMLYLASNASAQVTGGDFTIDDGQSL